MKIENFGRISARKLFEDRAAELRNKGQQEKYIIGGVKKMRNRNCLKLGKLGIFRLLNFQRKLEEEI